jgi:hypothetical protein
VVDERLRRSRASLPIGQAVCCISTGRRPAEMRNTAC